MESHVAFFAAAKVSHDVGWPLIGLGQEHAFFVAGIHGLTQALEKDVRLREVFAVGAIPLVQIGDGIQAQAIHAEI